MSEVQTYEKTIDYIKSKVVAKLGERINSIILYGSAAKGEYHLWESDIDILVIVSNEDKGLQSAISQIIGDVDLENATCTSLIYLSEANFKRYLEWGSPFLESVIEEGVVLYDDGTFEQVRRSLVEASR